MFYKYFLSALFLFIQFSLMTFSQSSAKQIREGNKTYNKGNYSEAEILYRRALETDNKWEKQGLFNIGNSLFKQERFEEAENLFNSLQLNESLTDFEKAKVYHNLGNSQLMQEKYKESIDSYKKSLRINPDDEDTRYNLSYAIMKLKQQKEESKHSKDKQEDKDDKDKEEEKDKDDRDKGDDEQQQERQQDKQQERQQDKQQERQESRLSRDDMERLLNALSVKDKQILEQLREKQKEHIDYRPEKDW